MLKIGNLTNCFSKAMEEDSKYVGVMVKLPDSPLEELIINRKDNFVSKLNYYLSAYNHDLEHKFSDGVKIVAFSHGNSLAEIEADLLG